MSKKSSAKKQSPKVGRSDILSKLKNITKNTWLGGLVWLANFIKKRKIPGGKKSFKKEPLVRTPKIEKSTKIIYESLLFIKKHWKIFLVILFFYILSYVILAYTTPNLNLPDLFDQTTEAGLVTGVGEKVKAVSSALFTFRSDATEFRRWAQFFLAIIFSLIFIHAIRSLHQGKDIRARDALYNGTTNLIPFVLNISLFAIQLIPFTIMSLIYNIGMGRGLFINSLERYMATIILILSGLVTFWFIPSTILALYVVSMPGIYPTRAMQAVRIMVSRRRPEVLKNILIFSIFIFFSYILLVILLITYAPRFANISLDLFFLIALPLIHTMMYKLYLKLLNSDSSSLE